MPRPRIHASNAERQAAYNERKRENARHEANERYHAAEALKKRRHTARKLAADILSKYAHGQEIIIPFEMDEECKGFILEICRNLRWAVPYGDQV